MNFHVGGCAPFSPLKGAPRDSGPLPLSSSENSTQEYTFSLYVDSLAFLPIDGQTDRQIHTHTHTHRRSSLLYRYIMFKFYIPKYK